MADAATSLGTIPTHTLELPRGRKLDLWPGRPRIAGVVNITPDSFSDGGHFLDPGLAVRHALRLLEEGADWIDLGAESTRPGGGVYGAGAAAVTAAQELARLLPVLERLRPQTDALISVDTRKAEVASAALAAGADLVNDISGLGDPAMAALVAAARCPIILMHSRGELATMQRAISFRDVVAEVRVELARLRDRAIASGIPARQIVLDPGIGFGKTAEQNADLLAGLGTLVDLGNPVLVGASRKAFLGALTRADVDARLPGSLAAAARAAEHGAAILRVHDVAATRQFLDVFDRLAEVTSW